MTDYFLLQHNTRLLKGFHCKQRSWLWRQRENPFSGGFAIRCAPHRRCLAGARSVTSCAKFITHPSFVDPAQTIKGAAGMTSAWKIPHMERWKMTCGFLSTEANSAFWQRTRERERGGGMLRSCISGLFFVYTVICQSSENIRGCFVNLLWEV